MASDPLDLGPGPANVVVVDGWTLYDEQARRYLGMPADEFEAAWKRGEFRKREEDSDVVTVLMLRPNRP